MNVYVSFRSVEWNDRLINKEKLMNNEFCRFLSWLCEIIGVNSIQQL